MPRRAGKRRGSEVDLSAAPLTLTPDELSDERWEKHLKDLEVRV